MREPKSIFDNIDWITVFIYLALIFMGWISIYASAYNEEHRSILDMSQKYGKQLIWIGTAIVIAIALLIIDAKFYPAFAYVLYGIVILLLLAVLVMGKKTAGAQSWFEIGEFKIQPSEFAKFATNLALAKFLSTLNIRFEDLRTKLISYAILAVPLLFILIQNDTGSAMVFLAFVLVLYREGLSENILIFGFLSIILFIMALLINTFVLMGVLVFISILIFLMLRRNKKNMIKIIAFLVLSISFTTSVDYIFENVLIAHQKDRVNVLLGKEVDPKGTGYNVNQSKIAIGSGGFWGKGFLQGTQTKYDFVPEQSTDFIFCTIGQEWGFFGSSIVIFLFLGLFMRLLFIAERQRSTFSRIYAYGVVSILFFHFAVNIGMTIGLVPVIGIPLPFFSYGGSSLWSFTILLFILVKLDSNRLILI
ncbi:MAG TPA: rod shape-determining protein RodA [Bacteroidales bacterium]|nr:rod shape-determining protein RodA [Bacteroidales bacterium]